MIVDYQKPNLSPEKHDGKVMLVDKPTIDISEAITIDYFNQIAQSIEREIAAVITTSISAPVTMENGIVPSIAAGIYLNKCANFIEESLIKSVQHYSGYQWLWYLRRMPRCVFEGQYATTFAYDNMLATVLSATSTKFSNVLSKQGDAVYFFSTHITTLRRILQYCCRVRLLSHFHVLLRIVGKGATLKLQKNKLPITIINKETEEAIILFDKRSDIDSDGLDFFLIASGTMLSSEWSIEEWEKSILLTVAFESPTIVEFEYKGLTDKPISVKESANYCMQILSLKKLQEVMQDPRLGGKTLWPTELGSLILLLRASIFLLPELTFAKKSLYQVGYFIIEKPLFFKLLNLYWEREINAVQSISQDIYFPSSVDEFFETIMKMKGCAYPLKLGHPLRLDGDIVCVDLYSASHLLQDILRFPKITGTVANARADHFEVSTQSIINSSKWNPTANLLSLRRRQLRKNGQCLTDIDAIGELQGTLLIVSCKSIPYSAEYDIGDYNAVRNVASTVEEAANYWQNIKNELQNNPCGDNYDFSAYNNIIAVVCTPHVFYSPIGIATEWENDGIRKVCSLSELNQFLQ